MRIWCSAHRLAGWVGRSAVMKIDSTSGDYCRRLICVWFFVFVSCFAISRPAPTRGIDGQRDNSGALWARVQSGWVSSIIYAGGDPTIQAPNLVTTRTQMHATSRVAYLLQACSIWQQVAQQRSFQQWGPAFSIEYVYVNGRKGSNCAKSKNNLFRIQ